jgi:hypothetical protein
MKAKAIARWDNEGGAPESGDVSARKHPKRPTDPRHLARRVVDIGTGEVPDNQRLQPKQPTGKGTPVVVRLQPDQLAALDAYIARQPAPKPSRPEAIRRVMMGAITRKPDWPEASI